jgi:alpha-1,2-mannosyltransferase
VTAALSLRGRLGGLVWWIAARPNWIYLVAVPALVAMVTRMAATFGGHYLDLEVYRLGVHAWLSGGDIYGILPVTSAGVVLPFIYPPLAALVMVPLTVLSWPVAAILMFALSLSALVATLYLVARRLWPRAAPRTMLAVTSLMVAPALLLEPVSQTFSFGQINLVLMAMVAADCLIDRPRWPRGLLVGLAAAIKLTPAVFVLYFLLRRDYRAAFGTLLGAAAGTAVGALVAPGPSLHYWTGGLAGASGVSGSPFFTNQTFQAVLVRAGIDGLPMKALWLLLSAGLLLLAAPAIRRGPRALAMVVTAGVGLLVSPTSWSHHWVWIAPGLLVVAVLAWRARSWRWALAGAVLAVSFVMAPFHQLPHDNNRELTWSAAQQTVGASYVIVTVAVYLLLWHSWRRRTQSSLVRSAQV